MTIHTTEGEWKKIQFVFLDPLLRWKEEEEKEKKKSYSLGIMLYSWGYSNVKKKLTLCTYNIRV
jgi:CRISPR/Cas system CSM-associated protein Csm4 (group 5 of RAMP superfamily)